MAKYVSNTNLNKNEWTRLFVLLEALGDDRLYAVGKLLQNEPKIYLNIFKNILREYETQVLEYIVDKENNLVVIKSQDSDSVMVSIPIEEFKANAKTLFDGIKNLKGSSVSAPSSVCDFAKVIYVSKPKAPAVKALKKQFGGKNDIFIEVRDGQTAIISVMGFSIKSKFGHAPTLFNAGSSSQFVYKLNGCTEDMMTEFNNISDGNGRGWTKCKEYLSAHGISMEFDNTQNPTYSSNLFLVRESMSKIMAWCVKDRLIDSSDDYEVMETVERMIAANPLNVPNPDVYYEKAMKDFLMAAFTGMTAAKTWDGKEQVNGGYIVVMDDGDVICYHSNDRESFRDYLYRNTYFEYVSSKKFTWSRIVKKGGEYYLPLNVSVRFTKHTR